MNFFLLNETDETHRITFNILSFLVFIFSVKASHVGMRRICSTVKIKDVQGQRMSAMKVFSESLKFLKNDFLDVLQLRLPWVPLHYISWILTVPAIWTDKAKQFMRLAALEVNIKS